jgi:hypothetical protein
VETPPAVVRCVHLKDNHPAFLLWLVPLTLFFFLDKQYFDRRLARRTGSDEEQYKWSIFKG